MDKEVLIKVENVSKKFCKDLNLGLLYGLQDLGTNFLGSNKVRNLRKKEFWAVNDISFEVKRGECVGLLGHNGAGKSTLLKVLTGLISPDRGTITMKGRINALIELTAGFNPILTGRENIYNNGAVLGLSQKEIDSKLDEIIAFSELEEFIDTPVQYYSSGMKVRLGFSVAAFTEPDVLILDEVLAVGDAGFRAKSFNKMKEIMSNAAVIFVSHSMAQVARICSDVIFMRHGVCHYKGKNIHKGIELYYEEFDGEKSKVENTSGATMDNFKINSIPSNPENERPVEINFGDNLELSFDVNITNLNYKEFYMEIQIIDKDLKPIGIHYTNKFGSNFTIEKENRIKIVIPNIQFIDGEYSISYLVIGEGLSHSKDYEFLAVYRNYTRFKVKGLNLRSHASFHLNGEVTHNDKKITHYGI